MKLNYKQAFFLAKLLSESLLHGEQSRSRNRVVRELKDPLGAFELERTKLIDKYSEKDEHGKPKAENGSFILKDTEAADKEYKELEESFPIELTAPEKDLKEVRNILKESQKKFNFSEGELYDQLREAFD